ncbi:uncharacterized protein [Drosophila bipectinata]|uniref:uncharacterized protein n=1 Tax=Drosophila bipectinata TaxID=42026 RepID=UPI001C88E66F|nr:uncharacterized protein LOC108124945 [Drosophila bipectinata]
MAGTGFAKCFILFMAVVILAQGVIYLGLSLWGITFRDCHEATVFNSNPFKFAMELIYFTQKDCSPPSLIVNDHDYSLTITNWDKSYEIVNREYIFMITYAVVSGLWIATSVLIILTLCSRTTKLISGALYWPWFLAVIGGSALDVVASVYHGIDLSHTMTLDDAFAYVGAEASQDEPYWTILLNLGVYFSTPAIVMLCLTARVGILWLLNIIGVSFCLSLSNVMASQNAAKAVVSRSEAPTRQPTPQPAVVEPQPMVQPALVATAVLQPTAPLESPEYPEQIRPKPLPIFIPADQSLQRQDSRQFAAGDRTTLQSPVMVLPPQVPQPQREVVSPQPDINTYRTTEAHPDRLNYPPAESPAPRAPSPAVQQLAVTSPLNNRYSEIYPAPPANPRVSEELRNQMPWSYTSMITKPPPPPRKPQLQVQIYPQIPEPDYADHDH